MVPHKKMQVINAIRESKYNYLTDLNAIFNELEEKSQEEAKAGQEG